MPACRAACANCLRFRTGAESGGRGLRPPRRPGRPRRPGPLRRREDRGAPGHRTDAAVSPRIPGRTPMPFTRRALLALALALGVMAPALARAGPAVTLYAAGSLTDALTE